MQNPLFSTLHLPLFQQIQPEHALPAITQLVQESQQNIDRLTESTDAPTWQNVLEPLEAISAKLHNVWSPIGHLNAVTNTPEWRDAYNACLPALTEFSTALGQNRSLYEKIKALHESDYFQTLNATQKKIVQDELRSFRLAGVALDGQEKMRYAAIQQRLSELTTKFEENILDATQHWFYHTKNKEDLTGLPEHIMQFSEAKAAEKKLTGYVLTLDAPIYIAAMKYAENRHLREQMYIAYSTRASDQGPDAGRFDNTSVMLELLELREEKSKLLGYDNYAEYSLVTKMADSVNQVLDFLKDLAQKTKPFAEKEIVELKQFAKEHLSLSELSAWDIGFVSEKLQQEKYSINEEMLRPYFPINKVLSGMFKIIEKIYGMHVVELKNIETWHSDVRFFEIKDESGKVRGQFYLDMYARDKKRGGAWMDDCRSRRIENGSITTPVAYLIGNFTPASKDQPALLTHDEVVTLFHEFGHGLHHMMTQINYGQVSGISGVEWDAVELPSQFMENFCWQHETIPLISEHFETKKPLPENLFQSMLAAKNFQSAMQMLRQLEFSIFDLLLYSESAPKNAQALQAQLDHVRKEVAVIIPPEFNRFQHSFSHIFAGGYSAGYYSYKWAEVLSSDAFSKFEENGVLDRKTGQEFLQAILERGGSQPAMELFVEFRGREPNAEALLRHSGLE
ncbi:MAG: M3 family metallopeptidase [Pseudomonadota bacterium]